MFKLANKPKFYAPFGDNNPNAVAKWTIEGKTYVEVVNKFNGVATGGWPYEPTGE